MSTLPYSYIAIEGVIGAGKTSLAKALARDWNAKLVLEQFADNPFLPKFYSDMATYAFPLEMSLMASRYQQLKEALDHIPMFHAGVISDYMFGKSMIFAGITLEKHMLNLFRQYFHIINRHIVRPDLLVYLYNDTQTLRAHIDLRGRPYERNIQLSYLEALQQAYMNALKGMNQQRVLMIDVRRCDFVNQRSDYEMLKKSIARQYPVGIHYIEP